GITLPPDVLGSAGLRDSYCILKQGLEAALGRWVVGAVAMGPNRRARPSRVPSGWRRASDLDARHRITAPPIVVNPDRRRSAGGNHQLPGHGAPWKDAPYRYAD